MVEVEKAYTFTGPDGQATLLDLFEGRRQLVVSHGVRPERTRAAPCLRAPTVVAGPAAAPGDA